MSDRIYIGPPGLTLANGRPLDYGETLALDADVERANVSLIDAGHLPELVPSEQLAGRALDERARALDIEGRSQMTADELRAAIAAAESGETTIEEDQ